MTSLQDICDSFNDRYPVGTKVRFWRGAKVGEGQLGRTTSEAWLLSGHTPVIRTSSGGTISLSHVEVR
jgi:hypothetical protein